MFTVGGTDVNIHKYIGPITPTTGVSATEPGYLNQSEKNIQDLLFLENRDRKYDTSVYTMRAIYRMSDNDFDLTQFGLFLTGDTIFMVFHLNDMVETLGRKIITGDVLELPHLKDYYPLDDDLPTALKRYYVVQDATRAAEGFAPTWYPHLWRVKIAPLVDSQEYKDIINKIAAGNDPNGPKLKDVLSTLDKFLEINDAIVTRAETDVPASGYDTSTFYTEPLTPDGSRPGNILNVDTSLTAVDTSTELVDTSSVADDTPSQKVEGYLTGDGYAPNGAQVAAGIAFPAGPSVGTYFLRLDYVPNRLFRFDGKRWVKIEDSVRTNLTPGTNNKTQRSSFVNDQEARMTDGIAWDVIRVASPYTPEANARTISFTLSTKTVLTNVPYVSSYGIRTYLNNIKINNTMANASGNISFTVSTTLTNNDLLEYVVYTKVFSERQSLSQALRPTADN